MFTTSQVGFYGKVDSVAYGAAKAGVIGLMHGVRLSADPLGIKVNCISPFALTRLGDIFPKDIADYIDPAQVASAVALLCSEACPVSGDIMIAGGGHFATARTLESRGIDIDDPAEVSAEAIAARLAEISDMRDPLLFPDALKAVGSTFDRVKSLAAKRELAAEIGGADFGIFGQVRGSAVQADFAVLKHVAILACRKRDARILLDQQDRNALAIDARQDREHLLDQHRREAEARLIHQQEFRPRHERAPDHQHLLFAARQRTRLLLGALLQTREIIVDALEQIGDAVCGSASNRAADCPSPSSRERSPAPPAPGRCRGQRSCR